MHSADVGKCGDDDVEQWPPHKANSENTALEQDRIVMMFLIDADFTVSRRRLGYYAPLTIF